MATPEYGGGEAIKVVFVVLGKIPTRIVIYLVLGFLAILGAPKAVAALKELAAELGYEIVREPSELVFSTFAAKLSLILLTIIGLGILGICLGVVFALVLRLAIDRLQSAGNVRDSREIAQALELALAEEELSEGTQARLTTISDRRTRRLGFWARLWFGSR